MVIKEEILTTISHINNLKVPRPDSLQTSFYKKYWKIVGKSVCKMIKALFFNGHMLKDINKTFITLIPKSNNPESTNHFRPISLCNICCKIITKILANRVKHLLSKIISPL